MAMANSLQTGQVALTCQLCIETNKIKWYCLKCEYYLCEKCKDLHLKVKSDDKHDIVKQEDIATYKIRVPEETRSSQKCRIHKELFCYAFCKTCNEPICTKCISNVHIDHETSHDKRRKNLNLMRAGFQIQRQYITNLPSVYDIVCLNNLEEKSMLLYNNDKQIVKKATLKKNSIRMDQGRTCYKKGRPLTINKMALTASKDCMFAAFGESVVFTIPKTTGNLDESIYSVAPLIITSIHILNDESIVIGARESGPAFQPRAEKKVIVLTTDGTQKMVHQFDCNNQALFTVPYRISSNTNRSLCVIDCISANGNGRLVILKQTGELLAIYKGNCEHKNEVVPFHPVALVTTKNDAIVVADDDHHMFHVVNYHGHCLKLQDTKYFEIYFPICLDIDNEGLLYVGCGRNRKINENAKVSILGVEGF